MYSNVSLPILFFGDGYNLGDYIASRQLLITILRIYVHRRLVLYLEILHSCLPTINLYTYKNRIWNHIYSQLNIIFIFFRIVLPILSDLLPTRHIINTMYILIKIITDVCLAVNHFFFISSNEKIRKFLVHIIR